MLGAATEAAMDEGGNTTRMLGLLGGMSRESTLLYYRLLNEGVKARLGGLHSAPLLLWSVDFAPIAERQAAGEWEVLGRELGGAGRRLAQAGAEALLICTNTMHRVHAEVEATAGVPAIHIADATGAALRRLPPPRPAGDTLHDGGGILPRAACGAAWGGGARAR
jgi:aspartate racemase